MMATAATAPELAAEVPAAMALEAIPAEESRPLFEPEPVEAASDSEAELEFDWKRQNEDSNYPARATSYLFSEEHPVRRLASIIVATTAIVTLILGVWWAVPRWTADTNLEPTADYINRTQQPATHPVAETSRQMPLPSTTPGLKPAVDNIPNLTFVRDIRTQVMSGHVFVTIHLSGAVQFQTQQIPERIYVDLHGVQLSPLLKATRVEPAGPIAQFKFSPTNDPDVVRLAMVLDAPCTFLVSVTSDPQAIVLDVQPQRGIRPAR
jgi:hypothetical protein